MQGVGGIGSAATVAYKKTERTNATRTAAPTVEKSREERLEELKAQIEKRLNSMEVHPNRVDIGVEFTGDALENFLEDPKYMEKSLQDIEEFFKTPLDTKTSGSYVVSGKINLNDLKQLSKDDWKNHAQTREYMRWEKGKGITMDTLSADQLAKNAMLAFEEQTKKMQEELIMDLALRSSQTQRVSHNTI